VFSLKPQQALLLYYKTTIISLSTPEMWPDPRSADTCAVYEAADEVDSGMARFPHHGGSSGKTEKDKPRVYKHVHRPVLEKRQGGTQVEGEKSH
jgi:hypothetical protein